MDPIKYEELKNQTLLFFVEKLIEIELEQGVGSSNGTKKSSRTLHDLSCQFGSKGFTREMRQIAGGSQSGLRKFLSEYPSIFHLNNDLVSYKETRKETTPTETTSNKNTAVEYFRERMLQYGMGVSVPVRSLLGHRSQAPTSIRSVSGQHLPEFLAFLASHPQIFKLNQEAESVILVEFDTVTPTAAQLSDKPPMEIISKENVLNLIQFYFKILKSRGPMLVEQLFHVTSQFDGNSYEWMRCPGDLKSFFGMHGECFEVHSNLVTLSDSYEIGFEYLKNHSKTIQNSTKISIEINKPIPSVPPQQQPVQNKIIPPVRNTLKSRVSSILLKTLENNESKIKRNPPSHLNNIELNNNLSEEEFKNYLISKTLIVSNSRKAKEIAESILKCGSPICVDIEGINLGDENGVITLIQICDGNGDVFLFDVLTAGGAGGGVVEEVARILSSEVVVKVLHDCRNDSGSLFKEYGILLKNVFDTQSASEVILGCGNGKKSSGLNGLCSYYGVPMGNIFKDKIKSIYRSDPRFWSRRPLTKQMIAYAAADVVVLQKLYEKMHPLIKETDEEFFTELVKEQILACIAPEETRQRRKLRKNERDLIELKSKIEKTFENGEIVVLSNRELRLLKHLTLPEEIKASLKSSLKIAKKLEKLEKREINQDLNSTSSSEMASLEEFNSLTSVTQDSEVEPISSSFIKVEELLSGLSDLVNNEDKTVFEKEHQSTKVVTVGTQTSSTGDIVVMKVYQDF